MVPIKILIVVAAIIVCLGILKFQEKIVRLFGKNSIAEKYLGNGGTYAMWKIIAITIVVFSLWYAFA
ncbi:MAG: hypothetical protein COX39_00550 [Candidatus Nealsonbacteria bacterium CG23_combo_of_CG06-09_8_20_14_all_40_13]|uniref:Uncharacterized protein n=1 Tax=Candidatus Nealsonbacteria bacterium CG23_combo_of_CG06-09_8_20_14_all_40_13 TaxID=1974724 RepID=A0A2G9YRM0_9BACT|nr:MAG: hypothetical protein COX39_00550 [Candidatus Nealsonbacteria bacterium CG23_combo_of_CG06-09_8_20_14_all_40_13]PIR70738.1 MAG: hypothetical protein COU44_03375 [Candidatus Nealsonbacteria bacterium CG10_big_fil_rev_8_21_14_0_10_40_24]PIU43225.1 MAG: hypothetical protein COS97_02180 [Candidatus Nealsonbacteria bacterium CG07_land_8_20_14_0_80_40_10]